MINLLTGKKIGLGIGSEYTEGLSDDDLPYIHNGKLIGYPFNLRGLVDRYGKNIIPDELGIYHLFYNDQLIYIGMSKSLKGRLLCHLKDKDMPFNRCLWFCASIMSRPMSIADILKIEYQMIKQIKPALNSMYANCR